MSSDKDSQHDQDRPETDDAKKKLKEGLERLSELSAEERLSIYEDLFSEDGEASRNIRSLGMQGMIFSNNIAFTRFRREDAEISDDGFVVRRKPRVFLSHSHEDKELARKLYEHLQSGGVKVWFDEAELRFGDSLIDKLRDAIDSVDILLALISERSVESEWVKKEIEIAMNQEIQNRRVKVIPILCSPIDLPGFLIGKYYADFRTTVSRNENLPKLVSDIKSHLED